MEWNEFEQQEVIIKSKLYNFQNKEITDINCPKCGRKIYRRTDVVLCTYPPQSQYECECGWIGYA